MLKIKKLTDNAIIPKYQTAGSAGFDLHSAILMPISIRPGETVLIPTGLAMEIPEGFFGAIYPRSGLATKNGLRLANCVGVVDYDYRGEVGVPLYNDSSVDQIVYPQERIAQMIIQPYVHCEISEGELTDTDRGGKGFGSTGV